jgi:hypothetical protein
MAASPRTTTSPVGPSCFLFLVTSQLMASAFKKDFVTSRIARLKGQNQRDYATAQWAWLNGLGPIPDPKQFEIGRREAQAALIVLASLN